MSTPTKIRSTTPTIDVYVKLAQYPILCDQVRLRMREELFRRGIVDQTEFEMEVKQLSLESQRREGLNDPYSQEEESIWQRRVDIIRDLHTDNYFGNNLGTGLLEHLIQEVLSDHLSITQDPKLRFNPEIAPWELLFRQGRSYEALPPPRQELVKHHLEELKVVLIKRLISDNLQFIGIAKHIFSVSDLRWVYERLIGGGKIGGKAAGILLALATLHQQGDTFGPDISSIVSIPETYFIGSEIIYEFVYLNKLERYVNQKYLPDDEMCAQFPKIVEACLAGELPIYIVDQLKEIIHRQGERPYLVRSSSLLEDNFSYSFAGKYESRFCLNTGEETENLQNLTDAIRHVYASTFNPDAMAVRQKHGLIDYDERMAVIIQPLIGKKCGRFFWPTISGIGVSCNPFELSDGTRAEDGILRLVWGYDERTDTPFTDEHVTIVPLKKPSSRHENNPHPGISLQKKIKVIDLQEKRFKYLPIEALLQPGCPHFEYISTTVGKTGLHSQAIHAVTGSKRALSFEYLTRDPKFVKLMRTALMRLENVYKMPVILEFVMDLVPKAAGLDYKLYILQCHPYSNETPAGGSD